MIRLYAREWVDFMFPAECVIDGKKTKEGWFYVTPYRVAFEEGWNGVIWSVNVSDIKDFDGGKKQGFLKIGWAEYTEAGMYDFSIVIRPKKRQGWMASPAFVARLIQFWADSSREGILVRETDREARKDEKLMDFEWQTVSDLHTGLEADPKRGFMRCDWHILREYDGPDDDDVKSGKIKFDKTDGSTPESQHLFATNAVLATLTFTGYINGLPPLYSRNHTKDAVYLEMQQNIFVAKFGMACKWAQARGFHEIGAHPDAYFTHGVRKQTPAEFCAGFGKTMLETVNAPINCHPAHSYIWEKRLIAGFKEVLKRVEEEWDSVAFSYDPSLRVKEIVMSYMTRLLEGKNIDGHVPPTTARNVFRPVAQEITQYRKKCQIKFPAWPLSDMKTV